MCTISPSTVSPLGACGLRSARRTSRGSVSRGLSAWMVQMEPGWPVFIASSRSSASPPRTSPMTIRSGDMRSASWTSIWMLMAPLPSVFAGRPSSETQSASSRHRWSSAWSSMVTTRSSGGMLRASTRIKVVLPAPAPPATRMLSRASTAASRNGMTAFGRNPDRSSDSRVGKRSAGCLRMVTLIGRAGGESAAWRRLPSGRVSVTIGLARSRRAPPAPSVYQCTRSVSASSLSKGGGTDSRHPWRNTKHDRVPLMRTSSTSGSARCSASGPRGVTAAKTRRQMSSQSSLVSAACRSSPTSRPTSS